MLAYAFLLQAETPLTSAELDKNIEQWFSSRWQCELDFDIEDALNKLGALQLIELNNQRYIAKPLHEALSILDKKWDNYFSV